MGHLPLPPPESGFSFLGPGEGSEATGKRSGENRRSRRKQKLRRGRMAAAAAASVPTAELRQSAPPSIASSPSPLFLRQGVRLKPAGGRRLSVGRVVASAEPGSSGGGGERFYLNFTGFPFPLGPFLNRRTTRTEVNRSSSSPILGLHHSTECKNWDCLAD